MQYITIEQQEIISLPTVLSSYTFIDGHIASYDMSLYNWIAEHTDLSGRFICTDTQGQATEDISYDVLHYLMLNDRLKDR